MADPLSLPQGGATLADILTTWKNVVTAINNLSQTILGIEGIANLANVSAATVVKAAPGRLATLSVTTAGSAAGTIYDATSTSDTTRPIVTIPNTIGITHIDLPANYGIVIAPGSGQVVTLGYS